MTSSCRRRAFVVAVPTIMSALWLHQVRAQGQPLSAAPAAPPPPSTKWYDKAKIEGFVDAYSSWNFNFPKPQFGTDLGRAFDVSNGFALQWAGVNVSYAPDPAGSPVGGFVGLRFGPGAYIYNGLGLPNGLPSPSTEISIGAGDIKEAYASWKPNSKFQIDFGKFEHLDWRRSLGFSAQHDLHALGALLHTALLPYGCSSRLPSGR